MLAVAPGEEEADELARDLAFFLGPSQSGPGPVLRVPADPVLPYDDLSPDRGIEMERLAALSRLHLARSSVRAVVVSARALARRVVFLTGGAFTTAAREFLEREAVLCVEKPFELEVIRGVLARKLAEWRGK